MNQTAFVDEDEIISQLATHLKQDVLLALNSKLIASVSFFRDTEKMGRDITSVVISQLSNWISVPGDYVCHQGDISTEMFFLTKGELEVFERNKRTSIETKIKTFTEGSYFGELSLLDKPTARLYSIRASTFVNLLVFTKTALGKLSETSPLIGAKIKNKIAKSIQRRNKDKISKIEGHIIIDEIIVERSQSVISVDNITTNSINNENNVKNGPLVGSSPPLHQRIIV